MRVTLSFPEKVYNKIYDKCYTSKGEKNIALIAKELIINHYINEENPEVEGKKQVKGENIHKFTLRLDNETHKKFKKKMIEQKDNYMTTIVLELFKRYFL